MIAHELSEAQLVELARRTEGYSGGDIATLIESACWMPVKHAVHRGTLEQGSPQPLRPANLTDFKKAHRSYAPSVKKSDLMRFQAQNLWCTMRRMAGSIRQTMT